MLAARGWGSVVASEGGRLVQVLADIKGSSDDSIGTDHVTMPLATKNPAKILANASRLSRLIKEREISLIHARSRAPAWSALIAARQTGVPFVTTYHGAYGQQNSLKVFYNSVMARADRVIANSQWTARSIAHHHPWAEERIVTIPRGMDFDQFSQNAVNAARQEKVAQAWGVEPHHLVVLLLGRLSPRKGQSVLIEAASRLLGKHPNLRFILAGDHQGRDHYRSQLISQIEELGLCEHVIPVGHCDDPAAAMMVSDIVVVASTKPEAFGRVAIEAGALERPVIVTRIGAVGETVLAQPEVPASEATGFKVEPGNSKALSDALVSLIDLSPKERQEMGKRGRAFALDRFSLQQMCDQTLTVYEDLLNI